MVTKRPTQLCQTLLQARTRTDEMFALVRSDSFHERGIPERHRLIFYLGHLETFDWNLIGMRALGMAPFHAEFDRLFAFGIDPPVGQLPADKPSDWPSVGEVRAYGMRVRQKLDAALDEVPEPLLDVAIEHRLMHAETFAYILHHLPLDRTLLSPAEPPPPGPVPVHAFIEIPGGTATLGRNQREGFGWDNEYGTYTVRVPSFTISKYKVTNRQYLDFVHAGATPPHFWAWQDDRWYWQAMGGLIPLPLDGPVHVTHEEALAYARWRGKSLPTEAQFHRAAFGSPGGCERSYPWGEELPDERRGNFDFRRWDPLPVTACPLGDSAFGVSQLVGNGWEWTGTAFHPFPGFEPFPLYPGYSAPFFDGAHFVLKGASPRTASRLLRRSFRNWFRPTFPYVYAGFRCVEN